MLGYVQVGNLIYDVDKTSDRSNRNVGNTFSFLSFLQIYLLLILGEAPTNFNYAISESVNQIRIRDLGKN